MEGCHNIYLLHYFKMCCMLSVYYTSQPKAIYHSKHCNGQSHFCNTRKNHRLTPDHCVYSVPTTTCNITQASKLQWLAWPWPLHFFGQKNNNSYLCLTTLYIKEFVTVTIIWGEALTTLIAYTCTCTCNVTAECRLTHLSLATNEFCAGKESFWH